MFTLAESLVPADAIGAWGNAFRSALELSCDVSGRFAVVARLICSEDPLGTLVVSGFAGAC